MNHLENKLIELSPEQLTELRKYAEAHGRNWKSRLRLEWMSARIPEGPILRALRNQIGPSGLEKIDLNPPKVRNTMLATMTEHEALALSHKLLTGLLTDRQLDFVQEDGQTARQKLAVIAETLEGRKI